ncbi:MAG: hypothetical protein OHK0046_06300 [Anaerolineae bacterium]
MQRIGTIIQLQIQRESLKVGERPNSTYTPEAILAVPRLQLTPSGALGLTDADDTLLDVHNSQHPRTRHNGTDNSLSFNVTRHYTLMQQRFGAHITPGCAGENILIAFDDRLEIADVERGVVIETAEGEVRLQSIRVAAPCTEFSQFVQQRPVSGAELKETLQFLGDGMRGFYATLAESPTTIIQAGDLVYAVDESML